MTMKKSRIDNLGLAKVAVQCSANPLIEGW